MKRTTYIIIGMLCLVLLGMLGGFFYLYSKAKKSSAEKLSFVVAGEQKIAPFASCKTLLFKAEGCEKNKNLFRHFSIQITEATEDGNRVAYPSGWDEYMTMNEVDDTLIVSIKFPENISYNNGMGRELWNLEIQSEPISFAIAPSVSQIYAELAQNIHFALHHLERDSLSLLCPIATISYSTFSSLELKATEWYMDHSVVENLYLDLDYGTNRNIDRASCKIGTQYLTGSLSVQHRINQNECKQVVWLPKEYNSLLSLSIELSDTARVVLK